MMAISISWDVLITGENYFNPMGTSSLLPGGKRGRTELRSRMRDCERVVRTEDGKRGEWRKSEKAALRRIRQAHHPVPSNVEGHELKTDWEIGKVGGEYKM